MSKYCFLMVKSFQKTTGPPRGTIWWSDRRFGRLGPQEHPNLVPWCVCRREEQTGTPNGDTARLANGGVGMDTPQGHKRVASSQTADSVTDDDDVRTPKRSRRMSGETYGVRNPIDVSYSSSRRWLQRKVSAHRMPLLQAILDS